MGSSAFSERKGRFAHRPFEVSVAGWCGPAGGLRPSLGPGHDQVKDRVLDGVIGIGVTGKVGDEVVFDGGTGRGRQGVAAQVVAAQQRISLVEAALFAEMDVGTVGVVAGVEAFCKIGRGQGHAGGAVVGRGAAAEKASDGQGGVVDVGKPGHRDLHVDDVLGRKAGDGGGADVVDLCTRWQGRHQLRFDAGKGQGPPWIGGQDLNLHAAMMAGPGCGGKSQLGRE